MDWKHFNYSNRPATKKRIKEIARLKQLEQNKKEADAHAKELDFITNLHVECSESIDWLSIFSEMPPPPVIKHNENRLKVESVCLLAAGEQPLLDDAVKKDEDAYRVETEKANKEYSEFIQMKSLAKRLINHEPEAYKEAISLYNPFSSLPEIGSRFNFQFNSKSVVTCFLYLNPPESMPTEAKTLTSTGKLSVKQIKKNDRRDLYRDHVCSSVIRAAREIHAILPIETVIVNALINAQNESNAGENAVALSMKISSDAAENFDTSVDPYTFVMQRSARIKLSKKSERVFDSIEPFRTSEVESSEIHSLSIDEMLKAVRSKTEEIRVSFKELIIGDEA